MLLMSLLTTPLLAVLAMLSMSDKKPLLGVERERSVAIIISIANIFISFIIYIVNFFSTNQYQLVEEYHKIGNFDFYLGVDGLSIYFVMLITIITPIALLSNWSSIKENVKPFLIIMLLLETLLLMVFIVLDTLLFYIFFESILPPLFLLIGIFGSKNRVRAGFYLFLYTLLGSLFLLLCILNVLSLLGTSDFDMIYTSNLTYYAQLFIFCGIFIAFAVKTPTVFLNTWLLKAHVESPLGGSIILAAIVLKLSLYGVLRLILPLLQKMYTFCTPTVYVIGVITILYASISTLRTIDIKELIAYSSVSHAAVYLIGIFSSILQGIQGGILLGLAHGFVSSGLFICTGGVLYDRSSTRLISFYRGFTQIMPLFVILFFILCLGNAGTPLSLNFVGEFMSLYGTFERIPLLGAIGCSSIVFSAAYTFYMFNRIAFAGTLSKFFLFNLPDLSKREFNILFILTIFTVVLGVYPAPILDGLQYSTSLLIYNLSSLVSFCDGPALFTVESISLPCPSLALSLANGIGAEVRGDEQILFYFMIIILVVMWLSVNLFISSPYKCKYEINYVYLIKGTVIAIIYQPLTVIAFIIYCIKYLFIPVWSLLRVFILEETDVDMEDSDINICEELWDFFLPWEHNRIALFSEQAGSNSQNESSSQAPNDSGSSPERGNPNDSSPSSEGEGDDESQEGSNSEDRDNDNNPGSGSDGNGDSSDSDSNGSDSSDEAAPDRQAHTTPEDVGLFRDFSNDHYQELSQLVREHDSIVARGEQPSDELVRTIRSMHHQAEILEVIYGFAASEHSYRTVETAQERADNPEHNDIRNRAREIFENSNTD